MRGRRPRVRATNRLFVAADQGRVVDRARPVCQNRPNARRAECDRADARIAAVAPARSRTSDALVNEALGGDSMNARHIAAALIVAALAVAGIAAPAHADINVGVTLSATGPAASLGIPEKNTFELLPTTIGGREDQLDRPRRRVGHDQGRHQHAQADHRGQGRRHRRLDDHAELAGDGRRRRRGRDADDLDGRVGADRRPGEPEDASGCSRRRRTTR